jgi:plasmid segregation protein ParM
MSDKKVARAIEIGFGTTSVVVSERNGSPIIKTFPSIANPLDKNRLTDIDVGVSISKRKVIEVEVDGQLFEVGDQAYLSATDTSRVLNDDNVSQPQYKALLLGALYMIHDDVIDVLALGLPMNHWNKRDELKSLAEGVHKFIGSERTIEVKKVIVIPQPVAGLVAYAQSLTQDKFDNEFKDMKVVCIDGGYLTIDVTTSHGMAVIERRSGATSNGFSTVLEEIRPTLSKAFGLTSITNDVIDAAFWKHKGVVKVRGKKYPFPVCEGKTIDDKNTSVSFDVRSQIKSSTQIAANFVRNLVGDGSDVDLFVLFGGSIPSYVPAITKAYPENEIVVLDDNLTTVVMGLFGAAKQALKKI